MIGEDKKLPIKFRRNTETEKYDYSATGMQKFKLYRPRKTGILLHFHDIFPESKKKKHIKQWVIFNLKTYKSLVF